MQYSEWLRRQHKMIIKTLSIFFLSISAFFSCIYSVKQTYDYKNYFSITDRLKVEIEGLSFHSNVLIEEVQYFRNQLTLREIAQKNLGMRPPSKKEKFIIYKTKS